LKFSQEIHKREHKKGSANFFSERNEQRKKILLQKQHSEQQGPTNETGAIAARGKTERGIAQVGRKEESHRHCFRSLLLAQEGKKSIR
jgi:hypothetical protein